MMPLDFLRNLKLNDAYKPTWEMPENTGHPVIVPQGNTNFDPFMGTPWGKFFDAAGASEPGGTRMAMTGLRQAAPGAGQVDQVPGQETPNFGNRRSYGTPSFIAGKR